MSTKLSRDSEEMIERLVTERIESISSPTGQLHPDMMWTTKPHLVEGAPTPKAILDFVQHLLTGRTPGTPMDQ